MSLAPPSLPRRRTSLAGLPLVMSAVLGLSGCATVPSRGGLAQVQEVTRQRVAMRVEWLQGRTEDSLADAFVGRVLRGEVPADSAIQVALLRNRRLQATFEDLGIAQADLVQAGLIANPVFSGEALVARGGGRPVQLASVVFPFIDALQRPLRRRVAEREFVATRARVTDAVIALATDVRALYVEAQAAEQLVEMRAAVLDATEASATAAKALHAAGNFSDLDLAQEQAQAAEARLQLIRARADRQVARAGLERVMGVGGDSSWFVSPRLLHPADSAVRVATLEEMARVRRLDLQAARHEAEAMARALGLTRSFALLPDGTIGVAYEREPDGTFRGGSLSIPLPLFDQGQARVAKGRALLRQSIARHDALAVEIGADVRAHEARAVAAQGRADHLRRVVLPLRRRLVDEAQKFVNAMEQSVFTLLLAKQAEIDAGQAYVESLRDYWTARAQLERAVGGSFAPLTSQERSESTTGIQRLDRPSNSPMNHER